MNSDPQCDREAPDFPGVVALGAFANDLGCVLVGVQVGAARGSLAALTPMGLAAAGWHTAGRAARISLALRWTLQVALAHHRPVTHASDGTPLPARSVHDEGDHVTVQLWVEGATTARETRCHCYRLRYAVGDASLDGPHEVRRHTVSALPASAAPLLLTPDG